MRIRFTAKRLCSSTALAPVILINLLTLAACGKVRIRPTASPTVLAVLTSTPTLTAVAAIETPRVPPKDLCREYLFLSVLYGEAEERAVATSYHCHGASIDSTGQSPSKSAGLIVHRGIPIHLQLAVKERPTAIDVRLYPGAGVSASFLRWPEELPTQIEAVNRSQPEPDTRFQYLPLAAPGPYSLIVKVTWGENVEVFYAISFTLEDVTTQAVPAESPTSAKAAETPTPTALSPSATATWIAPAPTATPSPPLQTPASGIALPVISFAASPSPADPAGAVTLDWTVRGASSVTIQWLDKHTDNVIHTGLPLVGNMPVDLSGVKFSGGNTVRFSLSLYDAEGALMVGADGQALVKRLTIPLQTEMTSASFTASSDPVQRGGTVTLAWDVPNALSVSITRVSPEGVFLTTEARDLSASGSIALPVPDDFVTSITYYLGARDVNDVLIGAYVTVGIVCPYDEHVAPQCPLTRGYVHAAYMPLEGGHMLWRGDTKEIYVLYTDGTYQAYEDTWVEGEIIEIGETPPPGLVAPRRGFGKLWATHPDVRDKLGWATADELGYTMLLETVRERGIDIYLALPDGRVLLLDAFSSRWEIV